MLVPESGPRPRQDDKKKKKKGKKGERVCEKDYRDVSFVVSVQIPGELHFLQLRTRATALLTVQVFTQLHAGFK